MALHEQSVGATDEWYTPPEVFDALGMRFAVDVAAPDPYVVQPVLNPQTWVPADRFYTNQSLIRDWGNGPVWMNAPFGGRNGLVPWLKKFAHHSNGIALVPDRTSAPWFQEFAPMMDALLFTRGKLKFIDVNGNRGDSPAQGTCLMAIGRESVAALRRAADRHLGFIPRDLYMVDPNDETKVERVARAMCIDLGLDPDDWDEDLKGNRIHRWEREANTARAAIDALCLRAEPNVFSKEASD